MGRDTDATGGSANAGNGEGNSNESRGSERGGSDRGFGGLDYGSAMSGGLGIGGISDAVADTVGRESFGGVAGGSRGGSDRGDMGVSLGSPDAAYSRAASMANPDMTQQLSQVMGKQVTRKDDGYYDDVGNRVAYSSGQPTSFGAQAATNAQDLGMSWNGAKAVGSVASKAQAMHRKDLAKAAAAAARARIEKAPVSFKQKDYALTALDEGRYADLAAHGWVSAEEEAALRDAFEGPMERVSRGLGFAVEDVTTPFDSYQQATAAGLVDPMTGKPTLKGWANVMSPVMAMATGPLTSLGFSLAGVPGAVAGALAPELAKDAVNSGQNTAASQVAGLAGDLAGVDLSGLGYGLSYAADMNTMSRAQDFMGSQPTSVASASGTRGDGSGGTSSIAARYSRFLKAPSAAKATSGANVSPAFDLAQKERDGVIGKNQSGQFSAYDRFFA